ncbi:OLC1v1003294C1 [Oldenlandia corymbosa var. corymbosa]|uniref:OLC1v1003294C1 n=1 Tax=Oldenlandia corymbosa var. corymbosa TaxID=529605 RepID=A0AAV1D9Q1_OLDCO|nr:OLC1v1003294C1 [Oldenlandia corymbosa var. corymbosa]
MEQSKPNQEYEAQPTKQIFILSGQSNMAGRGGVIRLHNKLKQWDGVVPPECAPDPCRIFRFTSHLNWEVAREPLHHDIDTKKTCGVGPGMSFANAVKERVAGILGLVPCAVGGTAIKEWERGAHLYDNMIKRARAAVHHDGGGEIKAVLWYQGESDTSSQHDADCYKAKMEELIHNVRFDLNLPNLPIIQVAIASGDGKYMEKIREAQKSIEMENVVCVDAIGLELKEDNLHLTTEAQVKLGQMLAEAYLANFAC